MESRDTSIGGAPGGFPITSWSLVAGIKSTDPAARAKALESLGRRYWKPVYCYIVAKWSRNREDSKDMAQAFFVSLLERETLQRYESSRGKFRTYLKIILKGFSANYSDAEKALKRGGGAKIGSLDVVGSVLEDRRGTDPDRQFDLDWKAGIVESALERVRIWGRTEGRQIRLDVFEQYDLVDAQARPTYTELAKRLAIKESDVRNYLFEVRERLYQEVRSELRETVSNAEELEEEFTELFGR